MTDDATTTDAATTDTTTEPKAGDGEAKTFTQEQVNDLIAREKGKIQSRYGDYDALKDKASKLDELEQANASELEKAQGKLTKAEERANTAENRLTRFRVAAEKKLPADLIDRMQGSSEEELAADADKLLELVKTPERTPEFDGGTRDPAPEPKTPAEEHNEFAVSLFGAPRQVQ